MIRRILVAMAAAILLMGCGGGSDSTKAEPTPTPRVYTLEELSTALPTLDEVPNGRKILGRCPGSSDCVTPPGDRPGWSVDIELEPSSPMGRDQEKAFFGAQTAYFSVRELDSEAAAKARMAKLRANEKHVGKFETKAKRNDDKKTYTAGQRGEGVLRDAKHGEWSGYQLDKRFILSDPEGRQSEPRQEATVMVAYGRFTISVLVSIGGNDLADGAALKLADQLIDDYLERLG